MSDADDIGAILEAWLVGDVNDVYPRFLRLVETAKIERVLDEFPEELREHLMAWIVDHLSDLEETVKGMLHVDDAAVTRLASQLRDWADAAMGRMYRKAFHWVEPDDLHDVVAARGPKILGRDLPYIIQACRWRGLDRHRRVGRQRALSIESQVPPEVETAFEKLVRDERMADLRTALARLANTDVMIVWRTAEGVPDATIAQELGFTVDAIRQRRHRTLRRLRALLAT